MLGKAEEADVKDAAKEIRDLQDENAGLKEQIDDVKDDLKSPGRYSKISRRY